MMFHYCRFLTYFVRQTSFYFLVCSFKHIDIFYNVASIKLSFLKQFQKFVFTFLWYFDTSDAVKDQLELDRGIG